MCYVLLVTCSVRHSAKCFSYFISSNSPNNLELGTIIVMSIFIIDDETEVWRHEPRSHRKERKSGFEHISDYEIPPLQLPFQQQT